MFAVVCALKGTAVGAHLILGVLQETRVFWLIYSYLALRLLTACSALLRSNLLPALLLEELRFMVSTV